MSCFVPFNIWVRECAVAVIFSSWLEGVHAEKRKKEPLGEGAGVDRVVDSILVHSSKRTTGLIGEVIGSDEVEGLDAVRRQHHLEDRLVALQNTSNSFLIHLVSNGVAAVLALCREREEEVEVRALFRFESAGEEVVESVEGARVRELGLHSHSNALWRTFVREAEGVRHWRLFQLKDTHN